MPDNVTYYAKILAKHKCLSCNQVCYVMKRGDEETHHPIPNPILAQWAAGIVRYESIIDKKEHC
jgi:hypothetical protein